MKFFLVVLGLHFLVLASTEKVADAEDREKRENPTGNVKFVRQSHEVSPEYLGFLQQLSATQRVPSVVPQQQYLQQLSATQRDQSALSQQQLLQQLSAAQRDQSALTQQQFLQQYQQQAPPTRYVLSQDGRLIEESAYLSQGPQQFASVPAAIPSQYSALQQPQAQPQQPSQQQTQPARPAISPELAEFSRQQQMLQQQYADAPLRELQTGAAARARQPRPPVQALPTGPNSQAPQVFVPPQQTPQAQSTDPTQLQAQAPEFAYTPVHVDPQLLQQQLAQLGFTQDARQFYSQQAQAAAPQQLIYQQPTQPQQYAQVYQQPQQPQPTLRPAPVTAQPEPQVLQQNLPQQYLIETTRPQPPQPTHYVPQEVAQQVRYVPQPVQAQPVQPPAPRPTQKPRFPSTLLQPVAGRGLFDPSKTSRSSIFVSRTGTSAPAPIQQIPVYRLPAPEQGQVSHQEYDPLVNAGYAISPELANYVKSKRQQPIAEESRNHVAYENDQDGVRYQYSPGSPSIKSQ